MVQEDLLLKKTPNQFLKEVSKSQHAKAAAASAAAASAAAASAAGNAVVAGELSVPVSPCPDADVVALAGESGHPHDSDDVNDAAADHFVNDTGGAVPASGDDDQFVVHQLIDKRSVPAVSKTKRGTKRPVVSEYLVWWQGCPVEEATWEPADNISGDLISAFESHQPPPGLWLHISSVMR